MAPALAGYIAGLVDGEGTITLTRLHARANRRLVVSIANTERQLLEVVADALGAGKITRKKASSDRHTPSYCFAISSRQALALLREIQPHLRSYKRLRAEMALSYYESLTPRNGKYTTELLARRREFEARFLGILPSGSRRNAEAPKVLPDPSPA